MKTLMLFPNFNVIDEVDPHAVLIGHLEPLLAQGLREHGERRVPIGLRQCVVLLIDLHANGGGGGTGRNEAATARTGIRIVGFLSLALWGQQSTCRTSN